MKNFKISKGWLYIAGILSFVTAFGLSTYDYNYESKYFAVVSAICFIGYLGHGRLKL